MTILAGNSADRITLLLNGKWSRRRVIALVIGWLHFIIYSSVSFHIPGHRSPYSEVLEARPCPL